MNINGQRLIKRDFNERCQCCKDSPLPGYLRLSPGKDDWTECPLCLGQGRFSGTETQIQPTRKIFLPGR